MKKATQKATGAIQTSGVRPSGWYIYYGKPNGTLLANVHTFVPT